MIPIEPNGKRPLITWKDFRHYLPSSGQIAAWRQQFPGCNWAQITGAVSDLVVLDVDVRRDGEKSLTGRVLPITRTIGTPSGGRHYYYKLSGGHVPSILDVLPGCDLKADGGYVLVPPSRIGGSAYEVVADEPIAPCPPWLLELVAQRGRIPNADAPPERIPGRITEGQRNATLTSLAGTMRRRGASEAAILAALTEENAHRCDPPMSDREVAQIARSVSRYPSGVDKRPQTHLPNGPVVRSAKPDHVSQATLLVSLADAAELFHTPDGEPFVSVQVNGHRETWPLHGKDCRAWLARRFHEKERKTPGDQAIQEALSVLDGKARFDGAARPVFVRLAEREGAIYLDLADSERHAVEITPSGWRVVENPPVYFRRPRGLLALPTPIHGARLGELRRFVNTADEDWPLLAAWVIMAARPRGPYPILVLHGDQGAAKSTTSRVLRALVDPNAAPLRAEPRDLRDLMIAAKNGLLIPIDNLSRLPYWLSDAFCRLATGGGFATRELYTDADEALFDAQRPLIINGIEEIVARGDLIDRAIILYLPDIDETRRREEDAFWSEFDAAKPGLLGALLTAVGTAMRNLPGVKPERLPRMADFARWAIAAAPGADYEAIEFIAAYTQHRGAAQGIVLEALPVLSHIPTLLAAYDNRWEGDATELLAALGSRTDESIKRHRQWPTTPRELTNILRRSASGLRAAGIHVTFQPTKHKRLIRLERVGIPSSPASPMPPSPSGDAR
jgi:hypothetical protein